MPVLVLHGVGDELVVDGDELFEVFAVRWERGQFELCLEQTLLPLGAVAPGFEVSVFLSSSNYIHETNIQVFCRRSE